MSIEGNVASILNERDLVINKGSDAGVKEGMKFKVSEPDLEIEDPVTHEPLGTLSREKIRVNIVDIQPKFSVGKTCETYVVSTFPQLTGMLSLTTNRRVVRKLKTSHGPETKSTDESGSFVEIGDPAIQIEDEV